MSSPRICLRPFLKYLSVWLKGIYKYFIPGRAIFAARSFKKGDFLLIYGGELITEEEAKRREEMDEENAPVCRFFFKFKGMYFW